jgi:hypothetical protein
MSSQITLKNTNAAIAVKKSQTPPTEFLPNSHQNLRKPTPFSQKSINAEEGEEHFQKLLKLA